MSEDNKTKKEHDFSCYAPFLSEWKFSIKLTFDSNTMLDLI